MAGCEGMIWKWEHFSSDPDKKKPGFILLDETGQIPGDDLLSQDLSSHYHWR